MYHYPFVMVNLCPARDCGFGGILEAEVCNHLASTRSMGNARIRQHRDLCKKIGLPLDDWDGLTNWYRSVKKRPVGPMSNHRYLPPLIPFEVPIRAHLSCSRTYGGFVMRHKAFNERGTLPAFLTSRLDAVSSRKSLQASANDAEAWKLLGVEILVDKSAAIGNAHTLVYPPAVAEH